MTADPWAALDVQEDLTAVLDATRDFVRRYIVMSDHQGVVVPLWVFHTHAFEAADYTPYLWVKSAERESGKSRLKEAVEPLVVRPEKTANITPAAVFRLAGEKPAPTFLIDELDEIFAPKSERSELRGLLNAGFRRGEVATRMVGEGTKMEVRRFDVYCPKLLAGKSAAALGDTLESRCIPIELQRKLREERVERFRLRNVEEEAASLYESLSQLAEFHVDALAAARPELPDELTDRQQDVWEPLLAISDAAGGDWPQLTRAAAVAISTGTLVDDESPGVQLLADCQRVFDGNDRLTTEQLLAALAEGEEKPWATWHHGNRISPRSLSRLLKPYRIRPRTVRSGEKRAKGYHREQFEDVWNRYLPLKPSPIRDIRDNPHEQRDCALSAIRDTTPLVTHSEQTPNPHEYSDVTDVTDKTRVGGGEEDEFERLAELSRRLQNPRMCHCSEPFVEADEGERHCFTCGKPLDPPRTLEQVNAEEAAQRDGDQPTFP
jgi:hypothetical protein